ELGLSRVAGDPKAIQNWPDRQSLLARPLGLRFQKEPHEVERDDGHFLRVPQFGKGLANRLISRLGALDFAERAGDVRQKPINPQAKNLATLHQVIFTVPDNPEGRLWHARVDKVGCKTLESGPGKVLAFLGWR